MLFRSKKLGRDFKLRDGKFSIGRLADCDIVLAAKEVSKSHLEIEVAGNQVRVRDDDSRNNTYVNHMPIKGLGWIELNDGDLVAICEVDFRFLNTNRSGRTSGSCVVDMSGADSVLTGPGSQSISLSSHSLGKSHQHSPLRALLAMTQTLRDVIETEDVLERAVQILLQIFPKVDRVAICFTDKDQVVTPKWWQVRNGAPDTRIRVSRNISRHVVETSEAVITNNALTDFDHAESIRDLDMRSVMCCPLLDPDGNVFGLIHADATKADVFAELDLEVLAAVAMQISLAINCSRLHAAAIEDALLIRDLEKAREVQQRYLPDLPPLIAGYDLAGFYRAARHVGGDYFDYISLPDGRLVLVLGDVVGKGVPAALTMVRLATETRAGSEVCQGAKELVTRLNQKFHDDFITLVVLVLDPTSHQLTISNAGHEPPLLRAAGGQMTSFDFDHSGYPLSVVEDYEYQETVIPLHPGESLIVYSDGFPDAEHQPSNRRFGSEPIAELFGRFKGTAEETIEHLVEQVDQFVQGGSQFDDMCMVCLKRTE